MKMAATRSLAALAKEPVPDYISAAYDGATMEYGPEYIIPKPFDRRVLIWEASAVAQAAVEEGIASVSAEEFSLQAYREDLEARLGMTYSIMRSIINQVRRRNKRIVFPEGDNEKVIRAAAQLVEQKICKPILLGPVDRIARMMEEMHFDFDYECYDPRFDERRKGHTVRHCSSEGSARALRRWMLNAYSRVVHILPAKWWKQVMLMALLACKPELQRCPSPCFGDDWSC